MNDLWHVDTERYKNAYNAAIESAKTRLSPDVLAKVSTPQAVALPQSYLEQLRRILIMGQETYGNTQRLQDCNRFDAWSQQIGGYITFNYAEDLPETSRPFWRAFDEVRGSGAPSMRSEEHFH